MKKLYLLALVCFAGIAAYAQTAASYGFSRSAGTFTTIVGGLGTNVITNPTLCTSSPTTGSTTGSINSDDGGTGGIPIGFTFNFCGSAYTTFTGNANGVLSLGGNVAAFTNTSGNIASAGWLMPLWDDLFGTCRNAYYETSGIPGSRVFTIEWNDWDKFDGRPNSHMFFQVKLYEGTNIIQFIYGTATLSGGAMSATIGIANSSSDYQVLSAAGSSSTTTSSFVTTLTAPEADGSILQFCPPLASITGNSGPFCQGATLTLGQATTGGAWSSSNTSVATVTSGGVVSGVAAGSANISYTSACGETTYTTVTVNPTPIITDLGNPCVGELVYLGMTVMGGTWSSSNPGVATVGSAGGIVTGIAAGTTNITYELPTGCMDVETITVNPLPAVIDGSDRVCVGSMITLTNTEIGGAWSSSSTSTATVGSSDGMVLGVAAGTTNITYTLPTGCYVSMPVSVTALPVVSGGSSVAICYGNSTSMTASGADVYSWSPADGLSCTNCSNPTASPTVTTTYTVTGTTRHAITYSEAFTSGVTPTTQCTSWDAFRATLNGSYNYTGFTIRGSMNPVGISCTDPAIAAAVANAMRTGSSYSGSSDGQTWYVDIGCTSGSCGPTAVALQNFPGCYCATGYCVRPAIGNDNWGGIDGYTCSATSQTMEVVFYIEGCTNTSSVTVSVNPLPTVYNVIGGGSYCEGGAGREIMLDSSNGGIRYQLYEGLTLSGSTVDGIEDTITFGMRTTAGTYTVEGTDTATGCINWMAGSVNITITPTVTPTVAIWQSTVDTLCQGTAITFATSITNGGSNPHYMWKVNGSSAGTDSVGFGHTPGVGTSKVSVILVSNAICAIPDTVMSDTLTTIIWPNGTPTITLDASPNDTVCEGTVVTVNPTVTFAGYTPSYIWVKNAILVSTSSSYTYTPIDGDDIYAVMTSNYMCRDTDDAYSNVVNMTVVDPVVPSVTITGAPGMVLTPGHADTLYATVVNGGTNPSYQWYLNGTIQAGATSNMFIRSGFADGDSVTVRVTRNDACGLYTVNSVKLRVYKVGVQTLAGGSNISLVPNPNNGTFSVTGSLGLVADEEVTAEVVNMIGQVVYTGKFMTQNGNIDAQVQTNNLANGQYMLNLHSSAGNGVVRFVIER